MGFDVAQDPGRPRRNPQEPAPATDSVPFGAPPG